MENCRICRTPRTVGGYCAACSAVLMASGEAGANEFLMGALTVARMIHAEGPNVRMTALRALQQQRPAQYRELCRIMDRDAARVGD